MLHFWTFDCVTTCSLQLPSRTFYISSGKSYVAALIFLLWTTQFVLHMQYTINPMNNLSPTCKSNRSHMRFFIDLSQSIKIGEIERKSWIVLPFVMFFWLDAINLLFSYWSFNFEIALKWFRNLWLFAGNKYQNRQIKWHSPFDESSDCCHSPWIHP